MILVREYINFERGLDPKQAMGIGKVKLIDKFFTDNILRSPTNGYSLNSDGTVDIRGNWEIWKDDMQDIPDYIKIRNVSGKVYVDSSFFNDEMEMELPEKLQITGKVSGRWEIDFSDFLTDFDLMHNSATEAYLSRKKREELWKMEKSGRYEWKVLHQDDDDGEDFEDEPAINYEIADLEADGWEVFHAENNYGQVEVLLFMKK